MPITVSVLLLAYNLEQYIAQALDGVLMQEVDFPFEIVVAEDCSTDNTRAIIKQYTQRYPNVVRPIFRPHNLGMNANFAQTLPACRGQYIALLDADDYWTSPHKLQSQVDLLQANPHYSFCFHNVEVRYEEGAHPSHPFHITQPIYHLSRTVPAPELSLEDLIPGNFIQTCSVVFRNRLFGALPDWFCEMPTYDWPLHIFNAQHGQFAYIDEIWGVYRVHKGGLWSTRMSTYNNLEDVRKMIEAYAHIDQHFHGRHATLLEKPLIPLYARTARLLWRQHKFRESLPYVGRWLRAIAKPRHSHVRSKLLRDAVMALRQRAAGLLMQDTLRRPERRPDDLPG